jgi:hypothetical protein
MRSCWVQVSLGVVRAQLHARSCAMSDIADSRSIVESMMRGKIRRLTLATLMALVVAALTGTASAASFRIASGGSILLASRLQATFSSGSPEISCELTFAGTISTGLLTKVAGTQFGSITGVRILEEGCRGGILQSGGILGLSWPLRYQSILGTLPSEVNGILFTIERVAFKLEIYGGFVECLYSGNSGFLMLLSGTNPYTPTFINALSTALRLVSGGFGCPSTGSFFGVFGLSPTQTITRL